LQSFVEFVFLAADKGLVHEIVGAHGTNADPGGFGEFFQTLHPRKATQWIHIVAIKIVNPLDVIERNPRCVRELALPLFAGKALKPAIFWWHESAFHYPKLRHEESLLNNEKKHSGKICIKQGLKAETRTGSMSLRSSP
jgi:hypothetical protein